MRIAVVGSGISGNLAARILSAEHEVDVFESASHAGGHAYTVGVEAYGRQILADVAFMVLNRKTYPNFCRMLDLLGVETQQSDMSLSVRCLGSGLEYQGSSLNGLFAQRRNLLRPAFYRMLADILRFNDQATRFCDSGDESTLLAQFLRDIAVGDEFLQHYLIPMSAAIWSADPTSLGGFPARFILGFFRNHGLLQLRDRPRWLTIAGRSQGYVAQLLEPLSERIHLNSPVRAVRRVEQGVELRFDGRAARIYDHVVLASHADQTLRILIDADRAETEVLSSFPYQPNSAVLHTDPTVLPRRRRAWASWNYHIPAGTSGQASVTYDLNRLQSLDLPGPLCLTLNPCCRIEESRVLQRFDFEHPVFSAESARAQPRFKEINGRSRVSFCGAYWGYGFHEDGVNSALAVTRPFGLDLDAIARSVAHVMDDARPVPQSPVPQLVGG